MKNVNKIFSWFLLLFGLAIICWALFSSYNIFTLKSEPPEFFNTEERVLSPVPEEEEVSIAQFAQKEMEEAMEKIVEEQLKEIFPVDAFPIFLNLIIWSIFAGILIFGGAQISFIGIRLIRAHKSEQ